MNAGPRSLKTRLVVAAITLLVAVAMAPRQGLAATTDEATPTGKTGTVVRTVTVQSTSSAFCSSPSTSLAVVQGSKVGFSDPQNPNAVLLVTSCLSSTASKRAVLYLLSPGTLDAGGNLLNAGNLVKTIQTGTLNSKGSLTSFAPGQGWAQLALAADKGVLFGCGTDGSLYEIEYSVFGSVFKSKPAPGVVTLLPKPSGSPTITSCGGLAWDPTTDTLYQSASSTIATFQLNTATNSLAFQTSFAAPCGVAGLSVVGGVLMVACNTGGAVDRLSKSSPTVPLPDHSTVTFSSSTLADLECDPVTFSQMKQSDNTFGSLDALWSRVGANTVQAFWVPPGTCGLPPTATVFAPAACPDSNRNPDGSNHDADGDGLWDCWEDDSRWSDGLPGIKFDGSASNCSTACNPAQPPVGVGRDLVLCVDANGNGVFDKSTGECANKNVKDIFVEIDYMQSHKPDPLGLSQVQTAFAQAPVDNPKPGGSGPKGITLHFLVDEQIPHNDLVAFEPCTPPATATNLAADFDVLKKQSFGTPSERSSQQTNPNLQTLNAKRFAFRYMLFAHNLVGGGTSPPGSGNSSSGCSEVPGDDSAIALGSFATDLVTGHPVGTTDQQAGTVMHELGHNLGLRHGGADNINCKPNYLSVMSYTRQFTDYITNRPLDYSRDTLLQLNEASLTESNGIGIPICGTTQCASWKTVFSSPTAFTNPAISVVLCPLASSTCPTGPAIDWDISSPQISSPFSLDINRLTAAGCDGTDGQSTALEVLNGFNDWANLQYNARASLDFAAGAVHTGNAVQDVTHTDKTSDQESNSFNATDRDADGNPDAFNCGSSTVTCAIDIKPGTNPKVLSKTGDTSNIQVAILASPTFDPSIQVCRDATLTLNEVPVRVNAQGVGTCSTALNANGRMDLICQFPANALPLGLSFGILEGQKTPIGSTCPPPSTPNPNPRSAFRARDLVEVVK